MYRGRELTDNTGNRKGLLKKMIFDLGLEQNQKCENERNKFKKRKQQQERSLLLMQTEQFLYFLCDQIPAGAQ